MRVTDFKRVFAGLAVMLLAATCMYGLPVTGSAQIGGATMSIGGTTLATAFIDFFGVLPGCSTAGLNADGCFTVGTGTGSFVSGSTGAVQDFSSATTSGHVSGAISIPAWMVYSNGVVFDLTTVYAGLGVDCASLTLAQLGTPGVSCTPRIGAETSPLLLTNLAGGNVSVTLATAGVAYIGAPATGTSNFSGSLSTQFNGATMGSLLGFIARGDTIQNSYSGTFGTTPTDIPEPGTGAFFIGGLLLLAPALLRRRLGRKA